jgi:hypothetical protein
VLAIEPTLAWRDADTQQVGMLHDQLLRSPKLLLGFILGVPWETSVIPQPEDLPVLRHAKGDISSIEEFSLVTQHPTGELRFAGNPGFENLLDNRLFQPFRSTSRVPLLFRYRGQVVPSFVLQAAMLWFGVTSDEVTVFAGSHIDLGPSIHIPVDSRGALFVDFFTPVTRYSMSDLLLSAEQAQAKQKTIAPVEQLKNSLLLLVRSDRSAQSLEAADGRVTSRGELFAAAIATIQNQKFIHRPPLPFDSLFVFAAMALAWCCSRLGKLPSMGLCLAAFAAYILVALAIFPANLLALPLVVPGGLIGFVALFRVLD